MHTPHAFEIYEELKRSQLSTPLQAVFAPYVEKVPHLIRQNASKWSQQLNQLPYNPGQRETFLKVFLSWLVDALPDLSEKELKQMTSLVRDTDFIRKLPINFGRKAYRKARSKVKSAVDSNNFRSCLPKARSLKHSSTKK